MKICLYLEFYHFLGGFLFKKVGTGLLSSYKNQKKMLEKLGIPFVEHFDMSCDILEINTPWLRSIYLIKKAKRHGKKVIIWSHVTAEDARQVFRFMPFLFPFLKKYLAYAYNLADRVFCPSDYTKSLLIAYGLPQEKLEVQSNGVDLKNFYSDPKARAVAREKYNLKRTTIGTVGLVVPRKGIETFISLARTFSDCQFVWFGKIYSPLLAKSLPKNLPANVQFTGFVDDIRGAYNALDIFLFPSFEENQGMAVLEAAAVAIPIVVRDLPVYRDWLFDGENCVKALREEDFEARIHTLLKNKDLREKIVMNEKELARRESLDVLSKKRLSSYNTLYSSRVHV